MVVRIPHPPTIEITIAKRPNDDKQIVDNIAALIVPGMDRVSTLSFSASFDVTVAKVCPILHPEQKNERAGA